MFFDFLTFCNNFRLSARLLLSSSSRTILYLVILIAHAPKRSLRLGYCLRAKSKRPKKGVLASVLLQPYLALVTPLTMTYLSRHANREKIASMKTGLCFARFLRVMLTQILQNIKIITYLPIGTSHLLFFFFFVLGDNIRTFSQPQLQLVGGGVSYKNKIIKRQKL